MVEPYMGQIIMYAFNFAPKGYSFCNGQTMAINQNQALFSILGTTYGGNGINTFGLPDLRGRTPISQGQGPGRSDHVIGQTAGAESVTLQTSQLPAHSHSMNANNTASTTGIPTGAVLAVGPTITSGGSSQSISVYSAVAGNAAMSASALANAGGSQPLPILQPYLVINFAIALNGIFPSRN